MHVGIVAKRGVDRAVRLAGEIAAGLAAEDVTVVVDEPTHEALHDGSAGTAAGDATDGQDAAADPPVPPGVAVEEFADCDLAVSVGGDGTFLHAARGAGTTPLLGVNLGEVGFLNAVAPADAVETARAVVAEVRDRGTPRTMTLPRLSARGPDWTLGPAVNEVALQGPRRGHGGGLDVTVDVDGETYTAGHADGVLVATPIGSTAYNMSEGGPLIHPAVDGLVVTTMAGDGTMPPLVVAGSTAVTVEAAGADEGVAVADGLRRASLAPPVSVEVAVADEPLSIAEPSIEFFDALDKLD